MGFSFHDESSMVEAAGSLYFASANDSNPTLATGSTNNVDQERRDDDLQFFGIELSDNPDIQMVDRSEDSEE